MKKITCLFTLLTIVFRLIAQNSGFPQTDSVCRLVKQYFNEQSSERLYQLTGKQFQQQIAPEQFREISEKNLFPLGTMGETVFEKRMGKISVYKTSFSSGVVRSMLLGLDSTGKLGAFVFRPYEDQSLKKNYQAPSSNPMVSALDKKVDSLAREYMGHEGTVGICIGVLKDGKTSFYGYGETGKGNGSLPDANTIFEIGSISKTFTATLLAIAVGERRVRLDDAVNKYLPDSIPSLEYNGRKVTLRDLSNHTSAIPRMPSNFQQEKINPRDPYFGYSVEDLFSYLRHLKLTREPGKQYDYSNTAVGLLGVILQRLYHKSFEELVLQYICRPLGMEDTRVAIRKNDSARVALGYDEKGQYNGPWNLPPAFAGAGAIRSTAGDMLKYAAANINPEGQSLSLAGAIRLTHDTTFADKHATLGLGWHYFKAGSASVLNHNGGTGGYRSYFFIDPRRGIAVICLVNSVAGTERPATELIKWLEE